MCLEKGVLIYRFGADKYLFLQIMVLPKYCVRRKEWFFTSMVETTRERLDKESVTFVVFPFWLSVMFSPVGESHVPTYKKTYHKELLIDICNCHVCKYSLCTGQSLIFLVFKPLLNDPVVCWWTYNFTTKCRCSVWFKWKAVSHHRPDRDARNTQ